jgi:hypothetical protein
VISTALPLEDSRIREFQRVHKNFVLRILFALFFSFDLNGTLIAGYWTYLAEQNEEVLNETRTALFAKIKGLATDRIPDYAFKSENAWKEYLERRHIPKEESPSIRLLCT